ncbi:MAG: hypothetical protein J5586_07400 [Clostridia bacterium]|nr:hypothetical protein [Clostridia bacterium]
MKKRSRAAKLLHLLWIIPLALAAAFAVMMYAIPAFERAGGAEVAGSADWMARLPDDMGLDKVVLPGTHDSAANDVQLAFFSKCQALTVGEQLEAGFRYLDIRLGEDGSRLKLMHGFANCLEGPMPWSEPLYLDTVLDECSAFLDAHPTECILFAVKHEHGDLDDASFMLLMRVYIMKDPDRWLLTDSIPTVGEARGRIVLLRRFRAEGDLPSGLPLIWKDQDGNDDTSLDTARVDNGSYTLYVQDRFEYGAGDKWAAFRRGMKNAGEGIALNFLSTKGTAAYGHPYSFAKDLNARLMAEEDLSGWVIVDFASSELAEHIYEMNFRN